MGKLAELVSSEFDSKVLKSRKLVLVDFWGTNCPPCKPVAQSLESLAEELGDRVDFFKINVEEDNAAAIAWSVRLMPTLLLFKDGKRVAAHVGAAPKDKIRDFIAKAL